MQIENLVGKPVEYDENSEMTMGNQRLSPMDQKQQQALSSGQRLVSSSLNIHPSLRLAQVTDPTGMNEA